jgi:hypothetical protein
MTIQLLYFDSCPSWETALRNLKEASVLEGLDWPIELIEIRDDDAAAAWRTARICGLKRAKPTT